MTITSTPPTDTTEALAAGRWRVDPTRSRVEFHVRHFWGLMTVKGRFHAYDGTLELGAGAALQLSIDAASLDTGHKQRDKHLRSADFFDVEVHPEIRFLSETVTVGDDTLSVRGSLHAAGKHIPLELDATLRAVDGELQIEAITHADHRRLGMTWSPLGMARTPSKLIVSARLVRQGEQPLADDSRR